MNGTAAVITNQWMLQVTILKIHVHFNINLSSISVVEYLSTNFWANQQMSNSSISMNAPNIINKIATAKAR